MRSSRSAVADARNFANILACLEFVFLFTVTNVASNSSVQDEGNACFDMAAAIPGLQSLTGNNVASMFAHHVTHGLI